MADAPAPTTQNVTAAASSHYSAFGAGKGSECAGLPNELYAAYTREAVDYIDTGSNRNVPVIVGAPVPLRTMWQPLHHRTNLLLVQATTTDARITRRVVRGVYVGSG